MTTADVKARIREFTEDIANEKLCRKNLYGHTWLSGSSTEVYPITIWKSTIEIQWKGNKKVYDKFIDRMVQKYADLFEYGYFCKSDGSCPSNITFRFKQEISNLL